MTPFILYLLKSSLSLAIFFMVYKFLMSGMTSHSLNRLVLLGILILSAIIPFVAFSFIPETNTQPSVQLIKELFAPELVQNFNDSSQSAEVTKPIEIGVTFHPQTMIYFLGFSLLFLRLMISFVRVFRLIKNSQKICFQEVMISLVQELVQPFTFLKRIVMTETDFKSNKDIIIAHEREHMRLNHSFDLILLEIFTMLHWFNPFMWMLRREMKLLHEYQADEAVINSGIDAQTYQLLVLERAVGERRFALANQFNQKPILKRFNMIKKKSKPGWGKLKALLFVPLTALMLQAFSRTEAIPTIASLSPLFTVQDSTQHWLDFWTVANIHKVSEDIELKQVHIPTLEEAKKGMPFPKGSQHPPMKERNVLSILINNQNKFLIENEISTLDGAIKCAENFINGKPALSHQKYAQEYAEKEIENLGLINIPKGVLFIQYDIDTDIKVLNLLLRGIGENYLALRQQKSDSFFNADYFQLNAEQKHMIDEVVPIRISFAAPKYDKPRPNKLSNAKKASNSGHLTIVDDNVDITRKPMAVKERNVMIILINKNNNFLVEAEPSTFDEVLNGVDNFIRGKAVFYPKGEGPEFITKNIPELGDVDVSKAIISIQCDQETDKLVLNHLKEGIRSKYAALVDEKAQSYFHKNFNDLDEDKQNIIQKIVPLRISLAVPKETDG